MKQISNIFLYKLSNQQRLESNLARKIHNRLSVGIRAKKKEDPEDIVHQRNTAVGTTNYCTFYFAPT